MSTPTRSEEIGKAFAQPKTVTGLDLAFGGKITDLMPGYRDLPEEFRRERDPFTAIVHGWFFKGLDTKCLKPKAGIDKDAALKHCKAIMASWEPSHEHKIAGVAWLMAQWFEVPQS